ncbi:STAS domain-containing protein [Micromonospora chersina]|uniref:STAS domain-containing protein n=1 Tax=Micromonospora chersina TaxID=47854 RepID=UPI003717D90A
MSPGTSWKHDVFTEEGSTRIVLFGELDLRAVEQLRQVLKKATEASGRVVADLAAVSFIDSTIINVFIEARNDATVSDRSFVVASPSPPVHRVLEVTGVLGFLTGSG